MDSRKDSAKPAWAVSVEGPLPGRPRPLPTRLCLTSEWREAGEMWEGWVAPGGSQELGCWEEGPVPTGLGHGGLRDAGSDRKMRMLAHTFA